MATSSRTYSNLCWSSVRTVKSTLALVTDIHVTAAVYAKNNSVAKASARNLLRRSVIGGRGLRRLLQLVDPIHDAVQIAEVDVALSVLLHLEGR